MPSDLIDSCLVVVALAEEFAALETMFLSKSILETTADGILFTVLARPVPGTQVSADILVLNEMGIEVASRATARALARKTYRAVLSLGISGSLSDEVGIGDTVIATSVEFVEANAKVVEVSNHHEETRFSGKTANVIPILRHWRDSYSIRNSVRWDNLRKGWNDGRVALREKSSSLRPMQVHVGPVACGDKVIASQEWRQILVERDRKFLAVDMESFGVLQAASTASPTVPAFVVRGVSDMAGPQKASTDALDGGLLRKLAIRNAGRLAMLFCEDADWKADARRPLDTPSSEEHINASLLNDLSRRHLPDHLSETPTAAQLTAYARVFELVSEFSLTGTGDDSVRTAAEHALASNSQHPLDVEGEAGSGKTTFLACLFWWFVRHQSTNPGFQPAFVSLHRLNERLAGLDAGGDPAASRLEERIRDELAPLQRWVDQGSGKLLMLVVDGQDEAARFGERAMAVLSSMLRSVEHKRIVGYRVRPTMRSAEQDRSVVVIRSIDLSSPRSKDFLQAICDLRGVIRGAQRLLEFFLLTRLSYVDLLLSSIAVTRMKEERLTGGAAPLTNMLEWYCRRLVNKSYGATVSADEENRVLELASMAAFHRQTANLQAESGVQEPAVWRVVNRHPVVGDYLTARYVAQELLHKRTEGSLARVNFVYPYRVDRFFRELVNESDASQRKCLDSARALLRQVGTYEYGMAHVAYLAGRIGNDQLKAEARTVLREAKQGLAGKKPLTPAGMLYQRTLLISLAYLGDKDAGTQYLRLLLTQREWEELNRGFHLEYYGDVSFVAAEPLRSRDELNQFPLTLEQLQRRLRNSSNPLHEIELHTLCSLAQHRHEAGRLPSEIRELVISIAKPLGRSAKLSPQLRPYVRMVVQHLENEGYGPIVPLLQLMRIKEEKRAGWLRQGLSDVESVGDHMYSATLLARFLLPEQSGGGYSKRTVCDMLFAHDLAEAIVGDVPTGEKTAEQAKREANAFAQIAMLDTYSSFHGGRQLYNSWKEFSAGHSLNAQIAQDFDKLENLMQLEGYRLNGRAPANYDEWKASLISSIQTDLVQGTILPILFPVRSAPSDVSE